MSNEKQITHKDFFNREDVLGKFKKVLGKNANAFVASVMQVVSSNEMLKNADVNSIYHAASVAATFNLPISSSLGMAYIVPYKDGKSGKIVAQFQLGYKGFKQLAHRSGLFSLMQDTDVREGELLNIDRLTGKHNFEWIQDENERKSKKIIGYLSYFKLHSGFEHTHYLTIQEIDSHAKKFSQSYKKNYGLWVDDFDGMARKTVTKLNLSKNAPLTIELQNAIIADQSVIKNSETMEVNYIDNKVIPINHEADRIIQMLDKAKTIEDVQILLETTISENIEIDNIIFERKIEEITNGNK